MRGILVLRGMLVLLAVAALGIIAYGVATEHDRARPSSTCKALAAAVTGSRGFSWSNGITSEGANWDAVLADGVTQARTQDRRTLASAVRADTAGWTKLDGSLPAAIRPSAELLHARLVAGDPWAAHDDPDVQAASRIVARFASGTCNLV